MLRGPETLFITPKLLGSFTLLFAPWIRQLVKRTLPVTFKTWIAALYELCVYSLEPAGPAAKAGVLIGDIVMSLGATAAGDTDDVQIALEGIAVGKSVEAEVLRGGVSRKIAITVGERPRKG